ncbi:MAG: choice-of-anchor I family protein [Deltaproteobacteria bacterium]|nr:choice-of-anchor I family protein [Deltaproteobacteria bacterium]
MTIALAGVVAAVGCTTVTEPPIDAEKTGTVSAPLAGDPTLSLVGSYKNAGGAIEISAYDKRSKRLFMVNSVSSPAKIEVINIANPAAAVAVGTITEAGQGTPNSVAIHKGLVAVAWEAIDRQQNGKVIFYDAATLAKLGEAEVGAVPDNVVFSKKGDKVLVANEGEPAANYTSDPEGSVTIIDVDRCRGGYEFSANTVRFLPSTPIVNASSVRIFGGGGSFGPASTPAQDFEPEYITVDDDGKTAYVTLQENNAIAVLDIRNKRFTKVVGLGFKDHSLPGNGADFSDRDSTLGNIKTWPVKGMYQPDTIAHFKERGRSYLIMANEGDAREYGSFVEEARVASLVPPKDSSGNYIPTAGKLRVDHPAVLDGSAADNARLGRLTVTTKGIPTDANGSLIDIYAFGARSFTVRDTNGGLVFDSGDEIEQRMNTLLPGFQNSDQSASPNPDSRSDNKGPEPEGLTVAKIRGTNYAFVGLERMGGVMVYDLDDPAHPRFITYVNNRNFTNASAPGDLGPEGLMVISAKDSPTRKPLLVVSNEISGSASFYEISGGGHGGGDDDCDGDDD